MCVCVCSVNAEVDGEGREEAVKIKEQAILLLGKVLAKHGFAEGKKIYQYPNQADILLFSNDVCNVLSVKSWDL